MPIFLKAKIIQLLGFVFCCLSLVGCAQKPSLTLVPNGMIHPNRVVVKKILKPPIEPQVQATFGIGNDPAIEKAYRGFVKTGVAKNIHSSGFTTFAYDAQEHPIIACTPLHLCAVQLEQGEVVNDIEVGDSKNWTKPQLALIGTPKAGSYQVVIKPKFTHIATDMVITTNKRSYNIGLVSQPGAYTHVANFYYPEETLRAALARAHEIKDSPLAQQTVANSTQLSLQDLHFDYRLRGDHPPWQPIRVFDDGHKTFIQMPPLASRVDLPVLFLVGGGKMQLVNYRYHRPYFIIDGLFARAYLVSGKGHQKVRVEIDHHSV